MEKSDKTLEYSRICSRLMPKPHRKNALRKCNIARDAGWRGDCNTCMACQKRIQNTCMYVKKALRHMHPCQKHIKCDTCMRHTCTRICARTHMLQLACQPASQCNFSVLFTGSKPCWLIVLTPVPQYARIRSNFGSSQFGFLSATGTWFSSVLRTVNDDRLHDDSWHAWIGIGFNRVDWFCCPSAFGVCSCCRR